jgi:hypothetical protein
MPASVPTVKRETRDPRTTGAAGVLAVEAAERSAAHAQAGQQQKTSWSVSSYGRTGQHAPGLPPAATTLWSIRGVADFNGDWKAVSLPARPQSGKAKQAVRDPHDPAQLR